MRGSRGLNGFHFPERELARLCQVQVKLPEFSLPVLPLVNHFLSAATISIIRLGIFISSNAPPVATVSLNSDKLFSIFEK